MTHVRRTYGRSFAISFVAADDSLTLFRRNETCARVQCIYMDCVCVCKCVRATFVIAYVRMHAFTHHIRKIEHVCVGHSEV